MIDAERVRAALTEAGRPDLAAQTGTNKAGAATARSTRYLYWPDEDIVLFWQALRICRGEEWQTSHDDTKTPEAFVEFMRAAPHSRRTNPEHWCPLSEIWVDRFHKGCWLAVDTKERYGDSK